MGRKARNAPDAPEGGEVLKGVWGDRIRTVCANHTKPKELVFFQNTEVVGSPFYMCECRNGGPDGEPPCANAVNEADMPDIILMFLDEMARLGPLSDLTNHSFVYKKRRHKITVKVLKYTDKEIVLGLLNNTLLGVR